MGEWSAPAMMLEIQLRMGDQRSVAGGVRRVGAGRGRGEIVFNKKYSKEAVTLSSLSYCRLASA